MRYSGAFSGDFKPLDATAVLNAESITITREMFVMAPPPRGTGVWMTETAQPGAPDVDKHVYPFGLDYQTLRTKPYAIAIQAGAVGLFRTGPLDRMPPGYDPGNDATKIDIVYFADQAVTLSQLRQQMTKNGLPSVTDAHGNKTVMTSLTLDLTHTVDRDNHPQDVFGVHGTGTDSRLPGNVSFAFSYAFQISTPHEPGTTQPFDVSTFSGPDISFVTNTNDTWTGVQAEVDNAVSGIISDQARPQVEAALRDRFAAVGSFGGMRIPDDIVVTLSNLTYDYSTFTGTQPDPTLRMFVALGTWGSVAGKILAANPGTTTSNPKCVIATAAYGTDRHPDIAVFRALRDEVLAPHALTRWTIPVYYRLGTPVAAWLRRHPSARRRVRGGLARLARRLPYRPR